MKNSIFAELDVVTWMMIASVTLAFIVFGALPAPHPVESQPESASFYPFVAPPHVFLVPAFMAIPEDAGHPTFD